MVTRTDINARVGGHFISDTNAHTNLDCIGFLALSDTVVASITYMTASDVPGIGSFTGDASDAASIVGGTWVPGRFKAITLTSGDILAVNTAHQ